MLLDRTPIVFFGGKGGVGKTTLATATALRLASEGRHVLLVSTDPAHNLGHIFGEQLSDTPTTITVPNASASNSNDTAQLDVIELDPERTTEEHLGRVGESMRRMMPEHLHGEVKKHMDLARHSPGTHEAAMLERIAQLVETFEHSDRTWDHIVFDTAPSGHTARLMALPEIMAAYTDGLLARRDKSDKFSALVRGMSAKDSVVAGPSDHIERRNQEIRSTLLKRRHRFEHLRTALKDPQRTAFYIVLTADRTPVLESAEFHAELTSQGVTVAGLYVNRRTPPGQGEFLDQRRQTEDEALNLLAQRLPQVPATEVAWLPQEVSTPQALSRLASQL